MKRIYIAGTADTKAAELVFLRSVVAAAGATPVLIDVGTREHPIEVDIDAETVARAHPDGTAAVLGSHDRGTSVAAMTDAFRRFLPRLTDLDAVLGIGGSGGTAIVTAAMRELPIGIPKIMVSTIASGDVSPYVGGSDIVMMPSITDLSGLNDITRVVLANAGAAIVAMANAPRPVRSAKPAIGLTMFGVTTAAVTQIVDRLDVVADTGLPYVGSVGALDMINFWAPHTLPAALRERLTYHHNLNVTLVRTTAEECRAIGAWIGAKLERCHGPVRFLIPERGVSALDRDGEPFFDPQADAALFDAIEAAVHWSHQRRLIRLDCHINDPPFADAVVTHWHEIADRTN